RIRLVAAGSTWDLRDGDGWTDLLRVEDVDIDVLRMGSGDRGGREVPEPEIHAALAGIFKDTPFYFQAIGVMQGYEESPSSYECALVRGDGSKITLQLAPYPASLETGFDAMLAANELKGYEIFLFKMFPPPFDYEARLKV